MRLAICRNVWAVGSCAFRGDGGVHNVGHVLWATPRPRTRPHESYLVAARHRKDRVIGGWQAAAAAAHTLAAAVDGSAPAVVEELLLTTSREVRGVGGAVRGA